MRNVVVFAVCIFAFNGLFSQTFSNNREKFAKDLSRYLFTYNAKIAKDFMDVFEPYILSKIIQTKFLRMSETCNKMNDKNMLASDVLNYVGSMYAVELNTVEQKNYLIWHELVDEYIDRSNLKQAKDFMESMHDFFNYGTLWKSPNFYWVCTKGDYGFEKGKSGLIFHFRDVDLTCVANGKQKDAVDSIALQRTDGTYDLEKAKWKGKGGIVTWEKVGLNAKETYAKLRSYEIGLRIAQYSCDTVQFHTPYFQQPILGSFSDYTTNFTREIDRVYPQFKSFDKRLSIPNIIPNMNYQGGFSMRGNTFVGVGTESAKAKLEYIQNGKMIYNISANEININEKIVKSDNARIFLKIGDTDSIYHVGANFTFRRVTGETEFARDKTGQAVAPFFSSFHNLDIYVDRIVWKQEEEQLAFRWAEGSAIDQRMGKFESSEYFNGQLYDRIGGNASMHPLVSLYKFVQKKGQDILTEGEAASALGGTVDQVKSLLFELSGYGFITYDPENKQVYVLRKTSQFVNARSNKADYDNMIFECDFRPRKIEGKSPEEIAANPNLQRVQEQYNEANQLFKSYAEFAVLDLKNFDLEIRGVFSVPISNLRNTQIYPNSWKVLVQKNRNFAFDGWVNSGKLEVNVDKGYFDYSKFLIQIGNSEVAYIRVNPMRPEDGKTPIITQSYISGVKGEILIDHPKNKSGAKEKQFGDYPKLVSRTSTRVFYNSRSIHRGSYDSTRFYFDLQPFEIDSMLSFNEKALRLQGEMITGGIFPKFSQQLKIMPDYSLGFSMDSPEEGFDFYGSGSKYNNQIMLSGNGLQGKGTIEYVTSIAESIGLFTFMPDSTIGAARFVTNPREIGIQMPDVIGDEVFITYIPNSQVLKARSGRKPIDFYAGEAKFVGTIYVRPAGFTGSGKFTMPTAQLTSPNFTSNRWQILADTSNFKLRNTMEIDDGILAFDSENLKCIVDFSTRRGDFVSNFGESAIEFPVNQFICRMDKFSWIMDVDELELEKNPQATGDINIDNDMGLLKSNFFSTNVKQDSLDFLSLRARFEFKTKTLYCFDVEYLDVADARIYPEGKKLIIRKKAAIDPLSNAVIVANYITKYHTFKKVSVNISGKRAYRGSGEYEYHDIDGNVTTFVLKNISLDASFQTVAEGQIPSSTSFQLSPRFHYYGNFTVKAAEPTIDFKGFTKLMHDCSEFTIDWFAFEGNVDAKNVMIPIADTMISASGKKIVSGIAWNTLSDDSQAKMYPVFMSELLTPNDQNLISATGFLEYNYEAQEYRISTREKLANRGEMGEFLALHTPTCGLNGDGRINLGITTPGVVLDAVGVINYEPISAEVSMNLTIKVNMLFDQTTLEKLGEKIAIIPALSGMNVDNLKLNTTLEQAFNTWSNKDLTDKFFSEYALRRSVKKMPVELENTMILTNVRLFSIDSLPQFSGFSSFTEDVVLVSFFGQPVMRQMPMELAFYRNDKGVDLFGIYFFIPGANNYFFHYSMNKKEGKLLFITNDQDTRSKINDIKPDKRKDKLFEYEVSINSAYYQVFRQLIRLKQ